MDISTWPVIQELLQYKYFLLFPLTVIEGPIITVVAGLLVALGNFNFWYVLVVVVLGDLTGDSMYYAIGRWGKETFIKRWGKYLGITADRVLRIEKHFGEHSGKTLLTGKLTHGIGAIFLVAAGLAKMPFGKYFWYNVLATIPKSLVLIFVGYYYGFALTRVKSWLEAISFLFIGLALAGGLWYVMFRGKAKE
ncbi:MAG: DedA family protein [Candidatus Falkowbacteria bacterium]